ncbi:MAG: protein kinase, partial [Polyangiaceae bacterium]|nr:protein kinase [Polyangiaceae bacterium]
MLSGVAPERYELIRLIGRGAMGDVFCARDTQLQRNVALKVLRVSDLDENDGESPSSSVIRMMREARAAAALQHPNIVTVHDVGQIVSDKGDEVSCFISMELIEGRRLRDYVRKSDVPVEKQLTWLAEIARALAFAHDRGIIHRDIKPENVMIRDDGVVKVLDFGLARRAPEALAQAGIALPSITEKGSVVGTIRYMAPEQMCGEVLDGRADQFSWGVVAYELLAGWPPWPGLADSIQIVAQVLTRDPAPIHSLAPTLPPGLADLVHRAIARSREERYPSMQALLEALDPFVPAPSFLRASPASPQPVAPSVADAASPSSPSAPSARSLTPIPSAPSASSAPPPPPAKARETARIGRRLQIAALAIATMGLAVALVGRGPLVRKADKSLAASGLCAKDGDCGTGRTCKGGRCESPSCHSNAECTKAAGHAAICRSDTGVCAALASEDCHPVAAPGDLENDRTVWFGAMFPLVGEDAQAYGKIEFQAVDLARSDFAHMLRGMRARPGGNGLRPLALVACDDSVDASRAAHHLVDDIGVPAVIGFRTSSEVIELSTSTFIPRGVLTIAAINSSPIISSLPQAADQPRMVFRTMYSSAEAAAPIGLFISEVLEPAIRAVPGALAGGDGLRVALVTQDDPAGFGFADAVFRKLRFNGRSALENESKYREIAVPFDTSDGGDPDVGPVAEKLLS